MDVNLGLFTPISKSLLDIHFIMVVIVVIILFAGTPDPNVVSLKVDNHLADEDVAGVRC